METNNNNEYYDEVWDSVVNIMHSIYDYYFFFQAEDGIRDTSVTGVQTCALPIYDGV